MGGRDHSVECEHCGMWYGGFNGPDECGCKDSRIASLQAQLEEARAELRDCRNTHTQGSAEYLRAQAEAQRYREALEEINQLARQEFAQHGPEKVVAVLRSLGLIADRAYVALQKEEGTEP